jgi:hypothetical protein
MVSRLRVRQRLTFLISCVEGFLYKWNFQKGPTINCANIFCERWFIDFEDHFYLIKDFIKDNNKFNLCSKHYFDILGTRSKNWGESINWHQDILSGRNWPVTYYKKLFYDLTGSGGSDVKVPWELSRFQHLMPLVQAYLASKEDKYAQEAGTQISDWIETNPCPYGVNWTCAMEVAIRACNWLWAWWAFRDSPAWTEEFQQRFLSSLWQHGRYIEKNLEDKGGIRTNHYLADVVGLLFLGIMLPQFKGAAKWKEFGLRELSRCMEEMVYPDGVCWENSTAYHRLVLEFFAYSAILCQKNDLSLPQEFWNRLEKMFEFIMYAMRPDGRLPMIGDADDGRFFIFTDYYDWDRWDFRYLLAIGAVLFRRADFKEAAGRFHEEIPWLWGQEGVQNWETL